MYFKSAYDTDACLSDVRDFCVYKEAFLKVYVMFIGGVDGSLLQPDSDDNLFWITIFYGFLFAIVMLNVLVAVIFDAWGRVSPYGRRFYWAYRHEFLIETSGDSVGLRSSFLESWDNHLSSMIQRFVERPAEVSALPLSSEKLSGIVLYVYEFLYLSLWFFLGLLSASLFWPREFRKAIFSLADEVPDEEEVEQDHRVTRLEETNRQLLESHAAIRSELSELKELLLRQAKP